MSEGGAGRRGSRVGHHGLSCVSSGGGGVIRSTSGMSLNLQTKMKAKMSQKMTIFEEARVGVLN